MAITKYITTALYQPLYINYRVNNNIAQVYLPPCALNVEVSFYNEDALESFKASASFFINMGLIIFDKVNNTKEVQKVADKNIATTQNKVNDKVNKTIEQSQDTLGLKNSKVETKTEKEA